MDADLDYDKGNQYIDNMMLEAAKGYSICAVCYETLIPPIYQCCNGHVMCSNCAKRINKCVECRVPMSQSAKIRNIALEKILNNLRVDCTNKNEGCAVQLSIESLRDHLQDCPFTPFNFCSNLLGKKDCTIKVNDFTTVSHLDVCHSVTKVHSDTFRLCLNVSKVWVGSQNDIFFEPVLVTSIEVPLLIRSVVSTDEFFTFAGFALKSNEEDLQNIRLKLRIGSKSNKVHCEWQGLVQSYRKFQEKNITNSFRISVDSIREILRMDPQENDAIIVHVFVWETSVLSQEDTSIEEEVHIFEQSQRPRNIPNSQPASGLSPLPLTQRSNGNQLQNQDSEEYLNLYYSPFESGN
ncbi:E3 ubiquitin-protein ligase SINAT2-like isoform X2 [Bradysia coprophila]|uniref:E3 ubiquitin-protein ligase SINAT2-like isoform X2 n=1 Tax=Bradysia coprophila TaxID=38358 RepID=UPI00187DD57F|nr:E3 ubiquitin-protein ligase SINAT2-like isoform X2 [Bradysia coprophila]